MKKIKRILALALAVLMAMSLTACGEKNVSGVQEGDVMIDVELWLEGEPKLIGTVGLTEDGATVLNALIAYLGSQGSSSYELDKDAKSVEKIGKYGPGTKSDFSYYWDFTVNGSEVPGFAADYLLANGDKVVYNYTKVPNGDTVMVTVKVQEDGSSEIISGLNEVLVVIKNGSTVLDMVEKAAKSEDYGDSFEISEDKKSVASLNGNLARTTPAFDDVWTFTVNGKAVNTLAGDTKVSADDKIVFEFVRVNKTVEEAAA